MAPYPVDVDKQYLLESFELIMRALAGIGTASALRECPFEARKQAAGLPQFNTRLVSQHCPSFKRNYRLSSHIRMQGLKDRVRSPGEPAEGQGTSNGNGEGENSVRQPPADVLSLWRKADAVCFDVDCMSLIAFDPGT